MAFTVPDRLLAKSITVTAGERKVFVALRDHLPEDYLVYYNVRVRGRHPDFIIIGPDLGIVVLEVKDWRLGSILEVAADGVRIKTSEGERVVRSPAEQAREYTLGVVDALKQRPALQADGRLCCAWGYGVVLPQLTRRDVGTPPLFGPSLADALGPDLLFTSDDLTPAELGPRLRRLLERWAGRPRLSPAQVDEIRAVLYPEIRLGWGHGDAEIIRVMDREQERLARSLGDGHRLLRGVAGSGKTVTLICRARHLRALHPDWRILVLCYNRVLANHLHEAIGVDDRVEVSTFHAWCRRQLVDAAVPFPAPPGGREPSAEYWGTLLPRLLLEAQAGGMIRGRTYDAILIDEGQDFTDDWYRAVLGALDRDTDCLFIALDSSQNIYRRRVSWRELGIQVKGRSQILRVNYRNTRSILDAAYRLISDLDSRAAAGGPHEEEYVAPDRALRDGPPPALRRHPPGETDREFVLEWVQARLAKGIPPDDILILALHRASLERLARSLRSEGVSAWLLYDQAEPGAAKLSTVHGAKGLDAAHVLLVNGHDLDTNEEEHGRRLLYIAMTRATQELCVCHEGDSRLMAELAAAVEAGRSDSWPLEPRRLSLA